MVFVARKERSALRGTLSRNTLRFLRATLCVPTHPTRCDAAARSGSRAASRIPWRRFRPSAWPCRFRLAAYSDGTDRRR